MWCNTLDIVNILIIIVIWSEKEDRCINSFLERDFRPELMHSFFLVSKGFFYRGSQDLISKAKGYLDYEPFIFHSNIPLFFLFYFFSFL